MPDYLHYLLQQLLNGLTIGSSYALIAIGYTMVYGIIGMINFAHGEIYMIGLYISFIAIAGLTMLGVEYLPLVLGLALLAAMLVSGSFGWAIERTAYRPLRGKGRLIPLISAIGMSIFLQNFIGTAQGARDIAIPPLLTGGWEFGEDSARITLSYMQALIFGTTLVCMLGLTLFIHHSQLGRACRAVSEDLTMARLLGIQTDRVIALTFVIGSMLAAVAGLLLGLHYGLANPMIGFVAGLKAFTAAVLGGIGSIPGAMLGGLILGVTESMTAAYFSAEYKEVVAFSLLVLILLFKPTGLLGRPEVEKI
jgi:branched-chain amino acid transport system permease protein